MKLTKEMKRAFQTPQVSPIRPMLNGLKNKPRLGTRVAMDLKANTKNRTEHTNRPKVKGGRRI